MTVEVEETLTSGAIYDRLGDWSTAFSLIGGAILAAAALSVLVRSIYRKTIGRRSDHRNRLSRLGTDAQLSFFTSTLGMPPALRKSNPQHREAVFVDRDYFVHVVLDEDESVMAFGVTTRSKRFKPTLYSASEGNLPRLKATLLESTFASVRDQPQGIHSAPRGRVHEYRETYYLGRAGNFQHFGCSVIDAGWVDPSMPDDYMEPFMASRRGDEEVLQAFRRRAKINTWIITRPFMDIEDMPRLTLELIRTLP